MDRTRLILIPAYNEAATIGRIVKSALNFGPVVVIDDRSKDGTAHLAMDAGATVLTNERNEGYEGNLNRGFDYAVGSGYENIVTIDADGEHDPSLLDAFFRALVGDKYPLALGVRPRKQRVAEVIMGQYFELAYGVSDILCGMKGYKRSLLEDPSNRGGDRVGTAAATAALRNGVHFLQIPVTGVKREDQPRFGSIFRANMKIFKTLGATAIDDLKWRMGK